MVENKSSLFGIIAIIIGASGLGLGAFSIVNFQVVEGPQGPPGEDGQDGIDGEDAPGGIIVGIMDPDGGEIISGNVTIRAMIAGSEDYTISILRNSTEIGTSLPMMWNTETVANGWWNITITATNIATNNQSQDEVMVYVQNVEDSTNIYYCSSQSEIENALDTIDTGYGTIIITENITLTSTINIDDGGYYIIRGAGPITINRNADDKTFYITNAQSFTLEDLIIDTTNITSSTMQGIYVNEGNDNPVYIQNVQIHGGNGHGIFVISENVWIQNCFIHDVNVGIYLESGSAYCHILDNSLLAMNTGILLLHSNYNTFSGNMVYNINAGSACGILLSSSHSNTIRFNVMYDINGSASACGISVSSDYFNTISSNIIYNITAGSGSAYGIESSMSFSNTFSSNKIHNIFAGSSAHGIVSSGSSNIISDNTVYRISSNSSNALGIQFGLGTSNIISDNTVYYINSNSSNAWGIQFGGGSSNSISGNTIDDISSNSGNAHGISFASSDYNAISSNAIRDIQASIRYGINGTGNYNVIIGNTLDDCGSGISVSGTGNDINHNVVG